MGTKKFTKEIKIAIASILSLLLLIYGINYLKGINLMKPANYYYINLSDVTGLSISSPVFVNGYRAGLVRAFEYDYQNPGNILVEISLDKQMKVSKGSRAEYAADLLGTASIKLFLEQDGSHQYYSPGDTLPAQSPTGLMSKIEGDMIPQLTKVLMRMDTIMAGLQKVVQNPALNQSLNNLESTTKNLTETSKSLNDIMAQKVPRIVDNLGVVSNDFTVVSGNLKKVDFQTISQKIDSTMTNVKAMTAQLTKKDNTMGLLLKDRTLYDSLNATVNSANKLMIDLQAHPKRYVHFSVFGKK